MGSRFCLFNVMDGKNQLDSSVVGMQGNLQHLLGNQLNLEHRFHKRQPTLCFIAHWKAKETIWLCYFLLKGKLRVTHSGEKIGNVRK